MKLSQYHLPTKKPVCIFCLLSFRFPSERVCSVYLCANSMSKKIDLYSIIFSQDTNIFLYLLKFQN